MCNTASLNNMDKIVPGVEYYPSFFLTADQIHQDVLNQVEFVQRSRVMYGREVKTPRLEAWFGPKPYKFGGSVLAARPMPPVLLAVAGALEEAFPDQVFDSCLVNFYRDGQDSVGWHADNEPEMGNPFIASVSLGAARDFRMRNVTGKCADGHGMAHFPWLIPCDLQGSLEHGSLLIMRRGVQKEWEHCLPKRANVITPRVNLTFRDCR